MIRTRVLRGSICALALLVTGYATPGQAETTVTLWSMGGDQPKWVEWMNVLVEKFEKKNPGAKVKVTWYEKMALSAALKTALRAGQGPDIIYGEPDQSEYSDAGYLMPLDAVANWQNIEPWARTAWSSKGHSWGIPISAYTNEIYYNKDLMKKLGVTIPPSGQVSQAEFLAIVKKSAAAGITPIALGTGDRPFPGAYLSFEPMLRKLGPTDYKKLLEGEISYSDPRVVQVLRWVKEIVDAGALPKTFSTMTLTDSYAYFYAKPGGLLYPQGTWYAGRAFAPPEKGGQPAGFSLGIMNYPAMDGGACNECKTLAVGGGYSINADTKERATAVAFMNEMATPEMGTLWVSSSSRQSGIKSDASAITGPYKAYFEELMALNKNARFSIGIPLDYVKGQCKETFIQVVNVAFPAGLIGVDETIKRMNAACYKGK
jgi:multiple sugar transport system substrate-binding protein